MAAPESYEIGLSRGGERLRFERTRSGHWNVVADAPADAPRGCTGRVVAIGELTESAILMMAAVIKVRTAAQ